MLRPIMYIVDIFGAWTIGHANRLIHDKYFHQCSMWIHVFVTGYHASIANDTYFCYGSHEFNQLGLRGMPQVKSCLLTYCNCNFFFFVIIWLGVVNATSHSVLSATMYLLAASNQQGAADVSTFYLFTSISFVYVALVQACYGSVSQLLVNL